MPSLRFQLTSCFYGFLVDPQAPKIRVEIVGNDVTVGVSATSDSLMPSNTPGTSYLITEAMN